VNKNNQTKNGQRSIYILHGKISFMASWKMLFFFFFYSFLAGTRIL